MTDKILITGANGFIGSHVVELLVTENLDYDAIYLLGRQNVENTPEPIKEYISRDEVTYLKGDILNYHELEKLFRSHQDISKIIHCAGGGFVSTKTEKGFRNLLKLNVNGTSNIINAAINNTALEKFVHFGSVSSYGVQLNTEITEQVKMAPTTAHEIAKYESEVLVEKLCKEHGINYTILQPSQVYGPRDSRSEILKMIKLVNSNIFPILGNGNNYFVPMIYVEDVARVAMKCINNPRSNNEKFILAWETKTFNDVVKIMYECLGKKPRRFHVPLSVAKSIIYLQENILLFMNKEPIFTTQRLESISNNRLYNSNKVLEYLNFKPKYSLEEGLKKSVGWYLEKC